MEQITRKVKLVGLTPILFDRYSGDNKEQLPPEEKIYKSKEDGETLVMPALNLMSFLSSQNTESAPQRIIGKRWRAVAKAALSFVMVSPFEVPITAKGKKIPATSKQLEIVTHVARLPKGIPNPKLRPMLNLPWELEFDLTLIQTPDLTENTLKRLFEDGGIQIGLGTYRGLYGKFKVEAWK